MQNDTKSTIFAAVQTQKGKKKTANVISSSSCVSFCLLLVLDRVNKELAGRQIGNDDVAKAIKDRLTRLHSQMMDLRDALNEAVNKTARAAEINNVNEKTLEDNKVSLEINKNSLEREENSEEK